MNKKINILDLFSWCWWLSEWFFAENYSFVWHIEMDKYACESLKSRVIFHFLDKNWKLDEYKLFLKWEITRDEIVKKYNLEEEIEKVYNTEISDETYKNILKNIKKNLWKEKLQIIIWWPPCQTYSQIWRARVWEKISQDPRNLLYLQYAKFLKDLQPEMFVFENVPGLRSAWKWKYLKDMEKAFDEAWYYIEKWKDIEQYMPSYWIPQNRKRLIIIWWKKKSKIISNYPDFKSLHNKNYEYKVNDFLSDLQPIKEWWWKLIMKYKKENEILEKLWIRNKNIDFITNHITRPIREIDREIYKIAVKKYNQWEKLKYNELPENLQIHKNKNSFLNRFNVVAWNDKITSTIVAHISADWHYYIHPDIKQNRSVSIREVARLQTFPDDFKFEWPRTSIFKQIWNAVPPLFSKIIAKELKKYFNK